MLSLRCGQVWVLSNFAESSVSGLENVQSQEVSEYIGKEDLISLS